MDVAMQGGTMVGMAFVIAAGLVPALKKTRSSARIGRSSMSA